MSATQRTEKLSEIADLNPSLAELLSSDAPVSFVPMSAVTAETASTTNGEDRRYCDVNKGYTPFLDGDLLVAKITPCFENGKIAQARLTHRNGFGSTEFHVVRPKAGKSDARYLLHFLRQGRIRRDGERKMTGSAGQRRVPEHFLAGLQVPLPPLPEQRRIAEVLDRAEALRAKRRAALAQLDMLTQSIFLDMFGDPATNPKAWPQASLSELGEFVRGITFKPEDVVTANEPGAVACMRTKNVQTELDLSDTWWVDERFVRREDQILREGDILVSSANSWNLVGKCCWIPMLPMKATFGGFVSVLRALRSRIDPQVLFTWFASQAVQETIRSFGQQTTNISNLNIQRCLALRLPVPPPDCQQTFCRAVAAVEHQKATYRASSAELDTLFASLQHRAFRGEL